MTEEQRKSGAGSYVSLALRLILGGLFVFAASVKLSRPQDFVESVMAFKIFDGKPLPDHLATLATFAIPWIELISGVLLIVGLWTRSAAIVLGSLLVAFIVSIALVLQRPEPIECGCFGKFEVPCGKIVGPCHLVRNAILLCVATLLACLGPGRTSVDRMVGAR